MIRFRTTRTIHHHWVIVGIDIPVNAWHFVCIQPGSLLSADYLENVVLAIEPQVDRLYFIIDLVKLFHTWPVNIYLNMRQAVIWS